MSHRHRRPLLSALLGVALVVSVVGCSSDDDPSSDASPTSGEGGPPATSPGGPLSTLEPLEARPETGKEIVWLQCAIGDCEAIGDGVEAAAEALDWELTRISYEPNPESINAAFEEAVDLAPDGIAISGESSDRWGLGLEMACEAGIPVFVSNVVETVEGACPDGNGIVGALAGPELYTAASASIAEYIAEQDDAAKIKVFTIEDFPVLRAAVEGFEQALSSSCPDCTVDIVNQQVADIGTNTPANVVAALQGDPDTDYAFFSFGALSLGVDAALAEASIDVGVVGVIGVAENFQALRDGTQDAWATWGLTTVGWQHVDSFARYFADADQPSGPVVPFELLTPDNAPAGDVPDNLETYEEEYQELWGL